MITVLCGGGGAARFLAGLVRVVDPSDVTAIVNIADDVVLHGLAVSPDLDTVVYQLAGAINPETGWGLADETFHAIDALARYGEPTWFRLGDRDLATHLFRTRRLADGAALDEVTAEIAAAWGLAVRVLPASNDPVRTKVTVEDEGEIGFQEYFVRRRHSVAARSVRFEGIEAARPGPGVLEAIAAAEVLVVAPSNPIVSIEPVLAIPGVRGAVAARRERNVAISPIIAGAAVKGPADRLLAELGHEPSVLGVARLYRDLVAHLVFDEADRASADDLSALGLSVTATATLMHGPPEAAALASVALDAVRGR